MPIRTIKQMREPTPEDWAQIASAAITGAVRVMREAAKSNGTRTSLDMLDTMADYLESVNDQKPR